LVSALFKFGQQKVGWFISQKTSAKETNTPISAQEWFTLQWLYTYTFEAENMANLGLTGASVEKQIGHTADILLNLSKGSPENPKISNEHSYAALRAML
jgi:hypothetical protein